MIRYALPLLALASFVAVPVPAAEPTPPKHWAFKPPVRPSVPVESAWVKNPIDAFVLAQLQKEGLKPSPQADTATLCRRLYLDLIGLPPSPKDVDAFLADARPDAYERLVEKLLASPQYGERWARVWLDAARYADSDGYEKDMSRNVWMYRDWVVKALNSDMPYDRFVIEQIAGDLLPNATQDQIVATGFIRMSMLNEEGGIDPEQFRMGAMFDRMDAVGRAFLGLSVACAQCHDHKFDPLTQNEYYRMFAFLNNDHEAERVVYTPAELMKIRGLRGQMREIERAVKEQAGGADGIAAWEAKVAKQLPRWQTLAVENAGDNSQRYIPQKDGSILAQGYAPTKFSTLMRGPSPVKRITAFRLELLNDPNLPCNGPGRSFMGTCALSEFTVEVEKTPGKREKVKFVKALADYSNPERELEKNYDDKSGKKRVTGPVAFAIDGKDNTAWGIDAGPGRRNQPRQAVFVPETPVELPAGGTLHFNLKQNHGGWNSDAHMNNNLGRFRLSVTDGTRPEGDPLPLRVERILAIPAAKRTPAQIDAVFAHWRTTQEQFRAENAKIEALWKQWPAGDTSLVVQARDEPRGTHMLWRGNWLKPGKEVTAGVPAFLHGLPDGAKADRLTFARWLADRRSPTTARAFVNRAWQAFFGTGLVGTPEEFGTQGEKPTHPELLDWLAVEFMEPSASGRRQPAVLSGASQPAVLSGASQPAVPAGARQPAIVLQEQPADAGRSPANAGRSPANAGRSPANAGRSPWSIKSLHRLIVTSATYRQSSRVSPELLAKDPYNRLLGRGPRFRADAEVVRDIALSASGLLNPKMGGPSVYAPAPQFLFQRPVSYGPFDWIEATGAERYRRGLYTFRRRSTPYPALTVFDAPIGEASCVKRGRTNTPLQALTGLNEVVFVECARALGKRAILDGGITDASRLTHAFRLCVARKPTADELAVLTGLLEKHRKRFAAGEANAAEVVSGQKQLKDPPAGVPVNDWAAFTLVARVLLNLDETITKE